MATNPLTFLQPKRAPLDRRPHRPRAGPVTLAIRAMRETEAAAWQAHQNNEERRALAALCTRIAAQFAADAAVLEGVGA